MIECPTIRKSVIRNHYDVSTLFYRLLWGPHIHHGYWEQLSGVHSERSQARDDRTLSKTSSQAQVRLTEKLAQEAEIRNGSVLIDIGCGMGGSSQWLAKHLQCRVTGVTLSPIQRHWAACSATLSGVSPRPVFRCCDAETIEFEASSVDNIWSIECTEHLFDKAAFFRRSASWLKPRGRFALCAWLAGEAPMSTEHDSQALRVCEGMFCPSLGSQSDYTRWFEDSGLRVLRKGIWTKQVQQTWEICRKRVEKTGVRYLAKILGKNHVLFLDHFDAILNAYQSGAMEYGFFVAEKAA